MPAATKLSLSDYIQTIITKTESDCWECNLRNDNRYGRFAYKGKTYYAHRTSWMLKHGPIPLGKWVLHKCDNPPCCNPDHLFLGDCKDRNYKPAGVMIHTAILNEDKVREIRRLLREGHTHRDIADWFGVTKHTITRINTGKSWSHVS